MNQPSSPPSVPPPPTRPVAGRYRLLEVGGRGGMAIVWRAQQIGPDRFSRRVAVKQMHAHLAGLPLYRQMFCEEARVAASLADGNIPQIYDFVEEAGQLYLVMEWVDGVDLATYARFVRERRGVPTRWDLVCAIGVGMLRGLCAAHERVDHGGAPLPIVHRDVSPHNVLISTQGAAKIIDFGLSLAEDREQEDTEPGVAKGKLPYLAPEIVRGGRATPKSDQFAVGSVLWEALAGRRAFEGASQYETYRLVANAELPRLEQLRVDVPGAFADAIHRALELDPANRWESVREMAQHLGRVLSASRAREDLYHSLARGVREARAELGIGLKTMDPSMLSSIPEELSGLVELLEEDTAAEAKGEHGWMPRLLRRLRGD